MKIKQVRSRWSIVRQYTSWRILIHNDLKFVLTLDKEPHCYESSLCMGHVEAYWKVRNLSFITPWRDDRTIRYFVYISRVNSHNWKDLICEYTKVRVWIIPSSLQISSLIEALKGRETQEWTFWCVDLNKIILARTIDLCFICCVYVPDSLIPFLKDERAILFTN